MTPGIRYIVTRGSDDGTLEVGDHVELCDDGTIECREAQGWVSKEDAAAALAGVVVEVDHAWYAARGAELLAELERMPRP